MRGRWDRAHPLLVGVFPVLFLYEHNLAEVRPSDLALPLAGAVLVSGTCWMLALLALRDGGRAALFASLALIVFSIYGRVKDSLFAAGLIELQRDRYLIAASLAVLTLGRILAKRIPRERVSDANRAVTFASGMLVILVLVSIAGGSLTSITLPPPETPETALQGPSSVYYIVVDEYPSPHILRELLEFEDHWFEQELARAGFHVAANATSNYVHTFLSLASTLNMEYLDGLEDAATADRSAPYRMIDRPRLLAFFDAMGYEIVAHDSGWDATRGSAYADVTHRCGRFSEFHRSLIRSTALTLVRGPVFDDEARDRLLCQFDTLAHAGSPRQPRFIFAHIVAPHAPYVFDAEGGRVPDTPIARTGIADPNDPTAMALKRSLYLDQLAWVNARLVSTVRQIVLNDPGALIVIHADHGSDSLQGWEDPSDAFLRERTSVLMAYKTPDDRAVLPNDVSLVNTWRILLDEYYGTDQGPLETRAYFSRLSTPFAFREVTPVVHPDGP